MSVVDSISIKGYRRLHRVDIEIQPLTVMIGANGVGKTSLLEVFTLLSASANGQLESKLSELGGLNEILTRDFSQDLLIIYTYTLQNNCFDYIIKLTPKGLAYSISIEQLTATSDITISHPESMRIDYIQSHGVDVKYWNQETNELIKPTWEYNFFETALSQVPKNYQEAEKFRKQLASCTFYGALNVAPKSPVRLPQTMRPATLPGANGEDLVSCLYYLRETDPERFELIEDTLKAAFPDFERLAFPPVAAGTLTMTWKDKNFSKPLYMHQLSEGTLRFLWLITLLQSPDLPTITLIDEPEVSLHPELLRLLVDVMREASQRTQLIVATHSDRLIKFLKPEEVLVCDAENGLTTMKWGDTFDLAHWLEDYSLDEIWAMNLIGGRP